MNIDERIRFDYAETDGIKLHYATAGSGERLVLLLHGFPEFWYSWRHQLVALSDEYTVVAPDLRGYNLSDRPSKRSDYLLDRLAGDIVGLVRHFERDTAAVIGHDWGASIAWAVAFRKPEILWKLGALQVPPAPIWRRNQTAKQFMASWYMFFFQLPAVPEFLFRQRNYEALAKSLRETTASQGVFSDEDIAGYIETWKQAGATTAMLNYYRANILKRMFGKSETPPKINVPTLFIYGEKDMAVLPQTVAGVGDMVAGPYREHRIPGAGHWVQQEAAEEVTAVLRDFLRG